MSYVITNPISVTSIGTLTFEYAIAVDDFGYVVGTGSTGSANVGITWQSGTVTLLAPLSADVSANAYDVNDQGIVVGQSLSAAGVHHAVSWTNGSVSALTDFGYGSRATAINASGVIVGSAQNSASLDEAVMWQNGSMSVLGVLPGGSSYLNVAASRALAINNSNEVVGFSLITGDLAHGFLWQSGTLTDLGTLSGGTTSEAVSINATGQIVGYGTDASSKQQAILWVNGNATQLATLSTGGSGEALAINDSGAIAGYSTSSNGSDHAVIWQNGAVVDLNSLLPSNSPWVLTEAHTINNQGQIVGDGTYNGASAEFTLSLGSSSSLSTSVQSALSLYRSNIASGAFLISDTAANVQANLDGLEALAKASKLFSITLTDAPVPTLTVTLGQHQVDADALSDINGAFHLSVTGATAYDATWLFNDTRVTTVAVSDNGDNISLYMPKLAPLVTEGKVTSLAVTSGDLGIDYKDLSADAAALAVIGGNYTLDVNDATASQALSLNGQAHLSVVSISDTAGDIVSNLSALSTLSHKYTLSMEIADSAANIASNIDALEPLVQNLQLYKIDLTDTGIPTLSITAAQLAGDVGVLGRISSGSFDLSISATGANLSIQGYHPSEETIGNIAVFSGTASAYQIAALPYSQGVTVTDTGTGRTSVDTLTGIDALQFSDSTVIIARTPSSTMPTSGNITELYGAVFGRLPDVAGLAYYQAQLYEDQLTSNSGGSLTSFAMKFLQSSEYTNNPAHNYAQNTAGETQFITDMYNNLLHRAPESGAIPYYLNLISLLTQGVTTGTTAYNTADLNAHATLLVDFSNSSEFLNNVQVTAQHPADANHWLVLI